ncbi:MAG: hypothetical protein AAGG79_05400 [Pseudomonadota bacterium]
MAQDRGPMTLLMLELKNLDLSEPAERFIYDWISFPFEFIGPYASGFSDEHFRTISESWEKFCPMRPAVPFASHLNHFDIFLIERATEAIIVYEPPSSEDSEGIYGEFPDIFAWIDTWPREFRFHYLP